jgi:hypothetical protein
VDAAENRIARVHRARVVVIAALDVVETLASGRHAGGRLALIRRRTHFLVGHTLHAVAARGGAEIGRVVDAGKGAVGADAG